MKYVVYFVPKEGVHPHATLGDYEQLWPIMKKSVNDLGFPLVHLTDCDTPNRGDEVFRVSVSMDTTVYSRDVAWAEFVRNLPIGETACMVEPDTLMIRHIPDLPDDKDLCVLQRPESCVPGWFKMSRRSGAPFYDEVVRNYVGLPDEMRVFHGDIKALHKTLGIRDGQTAHTIPGLAAGCRIDVRHWRQYGFRKGKDPYLLQFKGHSKHEMLRFA